VPPSFAVGVDVAAASVAEWLGVPIAAEGAGTANVDGGTNNADGDVEPEVQAAIVTVRTTTQLMRQR